MTQFHFGDKDSTLILVNYILKLKADKEESLKDVAVNRQGFDDENPK